MHTLLIVIHVIVCLFLIAVVLMQAGKGAEIGAVFGSSQAIFGGAGPATFLNKVTTVLVILFFITSLSLTYLAAKGGKGSVVEKFTPPAQTESHQEPPVPPGGSQPAPESSK
ncbi:preprotein translocase subunit SecG [Thermosulfuriphilus sp.]